MKWASVHGRCSLQSLLIVAPILLSLDNRQYVTKSALFFGSVRHAVWFVQSICTFVHFHCILGFELWRPEQCWGKQGGTSRCLWVGNYPLLNCALWIIHCLPNLTLSPSCVHPNLHPLCVYRQICSHIGWSARRIPKLWKIYWQIPPSYPPLLAGLPHSWNFVMV